MLWEHEAQAGVSTAFLSSPKLSLDKCFIYNSIETPSTCFLFLLENVTRKQLANFDYQNVHVNSLCSRHHYVNSAR